MRRSFNEKSKKQDREGITIMNTIKAMLSASVAAAAMMSAPAWAEDADPTAQETREQVATEGVQDIVVTANRREENVQRASLSIAAIDSRELTARGVNDSQGLNNIVPGLRITYTSGQVQTYIRGIGDASANAYTQSSVALNIDGVYLARSSVFGPIFFDVARVEVLRGPQGTLYGRNASGGAINVISNAPALSETSGMTSLEVGNFGLVRGQAVVNISDSDSFAIRAAVQATERNGYLTDGGSDDRSQALRVRAVWKPSDAVSLNVTGELAHIGGKGGGRVYRPVLFNNPWVSSQDPRITTAQYPTLRKRNNNNIDTDYTGISAQLDWDLGGATLTVIPSYRSTQVRADIAADFLFGEEDDSRTKSLEARIGSDGRLKWVVGGFLFKEDLSVYVRNDQRAQADLSGTFEIQDIRQYDTSSWALFGETTFSLTDTFRLIGGLRYTEETRSRDGRLTNTTFLAGGVPGTVRVTDFVDQSVKVDAVTWRAGAEIDVAARSMIFATASRGFKSGGFSATSPDPYEPEYVTAYTLGSKNRFFDNRLQLNLEGFYWQYRNQQIAFLGRDSRGVTTFLTQNAGKATIYGVSADLVWQPSPADTFSIAGEWLHTNYDDFRYATTGTFPIGTAITDGCVSGGPGPFPGQYIQNCSNRPLMRAPEFSANARYAHRFELANGGDITAAGTAKYDSSTYLGLNWVSPWFRMGDYALFDADLTYRAPENRWSLQLYVRNIGNQEVYQSASNQASIPPTTGVARGAVSAINAPRTFGARLMFNF